MSNMDVSVICVQNDLPIILLSTLEVNSFIKGYHEYKEEWIAHIGEILAVEREPDNMTNRYAVAIKKSGRVVGHLKIASFFLNNRFCSCTAVVNRSPVNLGDGEGMQVDCTLRFVGKHAYISILRQQYENIHEL